MTVYVDDMRAKFRRYIMCHMIGTDEAELHAMADRIGVARKWYQGDHYDIAVSKRKLAVAAGAVEITWRQCGFMTGHFRREGVWLPVDAVEAAFKQNSDRVRANFAAALTRGQVHG